jgi:acetylornithine deacetylase/succinyl-diaminopimelate desuccinylase-like protein
MGEDGSTADSEERPVPDATQPAATLPSAEDEVVDLTRELIRIDSSNYGDGSGPGERAAAEYVASKLAEVGIEPTILESEPGRANVVARWDGTDPSRDALLIHGHLDVVPADAADWKIHPFSGEIADGCVWGRGAVDMKDMDAMTLALVRRWAREGRKPPRDVVLAFVADEEAGGVQGAHWLVDNHADLFEGCTESISEVGGFSFTLPDGTRAYMVQTAQKGIAWMRLVARGTAGHGSMVQRDNAVTELAETVARIGRHEWPVRLTPTVRTFLTEMSEALGVELDTDNPEALLVHLGTFARIVGATTRNTTNPSRLTAGYKTNVVPGTATAEIDGRFLPGYEQEFLDTIDGLLGRGVTREFVHRDNAVETTFDGAIVDAMVDALKAEDPSCRAIPYCLSGGTDDKSFSELGIRGFGFAPLQLPPDLDFTGMFHGVDERVPVDALRFGVRVLDRFLAAC